MKKLHTRKFLIIAISVFVASILLYGSFLYIILDINKKIQIIEKEAETQAGREGYFRSVKNLLIDTEENRIRLNSHFLKENEVVIFIENLEELGRSVGADLTIKSVKISPFSDKDKADYEWLEISLDVESSWQSMYRLLSLIETLPVTLSIAGARMSFSERISDDEKKVPFWQGSFNIKVAKQKN